MNLIHIIPLFLASSLTTSKVVLSFDSQNQYSLNPSSSGYLPSEIRAFVQGNPELAALSKDTDKDPIEFLKFSEISVEDVKHFHNKFLLSLSNEQLSTIVLRLNEMTFENLSSATVLGQLEKLRVKLFSMVFQSRLEISLSPILFNGLAKFLDIDGWQYLEADLGDGGDKVKLPPFTLQPLNDKDVSYLFLPSLEGMMDNDDYSNDDGSSSSSSSRPSPPQKKMSYSETMCLFKRSSIKMLDIMLERLDDYRKKEKYAKSMILSMSEFELFQSVLGDRKGDF